MKEIDPPYPFLFGATRFGDCIDDEWFIVYLLHTISTYIPESVISLLDNDGDVILIEAALDLPAWLDPSNSDNRVYLHQGQVHIIPLPNTPAAILQVPTTGRLLREKAIDQVRHNQHLTLASTSIQKAIQDRMHRYPEIHRATCILPHKAAFVLLSEPQLITLAIEAFYLRDPFSMKACAAMKTFPPHEGSTETIIRFTKTTYAQAKSQKFYAPKPFRLPSAVHEKTRFAQAELGMKVACGLEMLYYNQQQQQEDTTMDVDTYPFEKDKKYKAYVDHLKTLGYFRTEREGSQLYKKLERQSKEQYLLYKKQEEENIVSYDHLDAEDEETFKYSSRVLSSATVRQRIDQLLSQFSMEALEALLEENKTEKEDSDDWMNVDPQQLEELLMKRMGHMNEGMMKDLAKDFGMSSNEEGMDLESIMSNLENFVEHSKSGVDGVVFPGEEDEDDDDDDESEEEEEEFKAIQFDMEKFMNILKGTSSDIPVEQDLGQVMEEMDQEIYSHDKISGSFAKLSTNEDGEEDEEAPVDVQLNLVKNVLESFKSQQGLPGPVSNILNQFGVVLPGDDEEV